MSQTKCKPLHQLYEDKRQTLSLLQTGGLTAVRRLVQDWNKSNMSNICLSKKALNVTLLKKSEEISSGEEEFSKCDTCFLVQKFIHWCKF